MAKGYVLLSGGVDSSTCLAKACKEYGAEHVRAVSVSYGQRHTKELVQANAVAKFFGCSHSIRDIAGLIGKGGLTDENLQIPKARYDELPYGVSPTYVPFRNGLLISLVASMAAADPDALSIYIGTHAEDGDNWAYPDCTPEFIGGMANAIFIGTYQKVRLVTPLLFLRKHEVVRMGTDLGVPWSLTWSCYEGKELHCGECPTCIARMEAFQDAGVSDPTLYALESQNSGGV